MNKDYRINKEKIDQAKTFLREMDIDLWLIRTKEGSDPCMPLMFGFSVVGDAILVITKEKAICIISNIDAQDATESQLFDEIYKYGKEGIGEHLDRVCKMINPNKIALNYSRAAHLSDGLTVGQYRSLVKMLGDYKDRIISSEIFLQRIRSIKSETEIKFIKKAIEITLDIYDEVFKKTRKGMSEIEIGQLFIDGMIKRNVVNGITRKLTPPIVMKHQIAHRPPGKARIEGGDYLIFDFSVDYNGYTSDIARTCYVLKNGETKASEAMEKAFRQIQGAQDKAIEAMKVGARGCDVDQAARQHILDGGYPNIFHAVGHQVGRQVHDGGVILGPLKKNYRKEALGEIEAGMVFAIEPTILIEEGPAIISEENVLVTKNGVEFLSERQKELVLIKS